MDSALEHAVHDLKTDLGKGLAASEAAERLLQYGDNEIASVAVNPLAQFAGKFWGLSAWMLELVILLSWYLQKYDDMMIVAGLLIVNAALGYFEERQAEQALAELKSKLKITAKVLRDGRWTTVAAGRLVPGDVIRLRAGDFVPADCKLADGTVSVDQSSLTGESASVVKTKPDDLYSGSIVQRGEATALVLTTGAATFFGKTAQLVQSARPKLHIEELITSVVQRLFIIVGALLLVMLAVVIYRQFPVVETLPLVLVVLLSAVPVALPVMLTVAMAVGANELTGQGVLVTRLSASEDAAMVDVICVDKTGTITANKLTVMQLLPQLPFSENELLKTALYASQEADQDPIDKAIIQAASARGVDKTSGVIENFTPFSPENRRTEASVNESGSRFLAAKGAVEAILTLCRVPPEQAESIRSRVEALAAGGNKVLAVARSEESHAPVFGGLIGLNDAPRPDSRELILQAESLGIRVKMLTGDALVTAREVARQVGLRGEIVSAKVVRNLLQTTPVQAGALIWEAGGFAEVYPEDKYLIVKALQQAGHIVGMTGDGVNDAPALKQAEVGIAVSNAADVAKGAASVVLTTEGLVGIIGLIKVGRTVHRRIQIWVVNKISRTILKASFVVGSYLLTGHFFVSAFAMLLLVFMTDFAKVALATDTAQWSAKPTKLNLAPLSKTGIALGLAMVIEITGLLALGIKWFALPTGGESLSTFSFLALFFFAVFSVFVVRQNGHFWASKPSAILSAVLLGDAIAAGLIGVFGLLSLPGIGWEPVLMIIAYSGFFSLVVNDYIKPLFQGDAQ